MGVRETLIELIDEALQRTDGTARVVAEYFRDKIADHLIANGVTVQSEIDTKTFQLMRERERLREEKEGLANAVNVLEEINSDLLKKLKSVTVQEWIPVTERLPDTIQCYAGTAYSEAVNVLTAGRKFLTAIWDGIDFIADAEFWDAEGEEITHWTPVLLPLPEPPKGE